MPLDRMSPNDGLTRFSHNHLMGTLRGTNSKDGGARMIIVR